MGTAVIGCILFIFMVFAVKSCCKRMARGCCGQEGSAAPLEAADRAEEHYPYRKYLEVEGMSCANCAQRIQNAFHARPDCWCTVNLQEGTVLVRMKTQLEDEKLRKTVEKLGYRVVKIYKP